MAKRLGWADPVGQVFKQDGVQFEVIGVVKDFHSYSFRTQMKPTIFKAAQKDDYRYLSVRATEGSEIKVYKALQAGWANLFPQTPFDGGYQEDVWGPYFDQIGIYSIVWRTFSLLAITLASLGLYGLMTLNVTGRIKEFSIRKVLGAGMKNLTLNIGSQYFALFGVSILVGAPLGYLAATFMVTSAYSYHMPFGYSGVIIAVAILLALLLVTLLTQVPKVMKFNPVDGLKVD
jgi:hypothetical protein